MPWFGRSAPAVDAVFAQAEPTANTPPPRLPAPASFPSHGGPRAALPVPSASLTPRAGGAAAAVPLPQESGVRSQESGVRSQESGDRQRAPGLTIDDVLGVWASADKKSGWQAIRKGSYAHAWIGREVESGRQPDRTAAIAALRDVLAAHGFRGEALRVNLFVRIYWTALLLGGRQTSKTSEVPLSALRALARLVRRTRLGEWILRSDSAEQAKHVWERTVSEGLSAAAVTEAVAQLRPPRVSGRRRPSVRDAAARLIRQLSGLGREDLERVAEACQARLRNARPGALISGPQQAAA